MEKTRRERQEKQPYAIAMTEGQMVMAGLWAKWRDPKSGDEIQSCTILTCGPNDVMAELHDRMPVILAESDWPKWLGEEPATDDELLALLKPCPDAVLKMWPVNEAVGNVRNKGSHLLLPILFFEPFDQLTETPGADRVGMIGIKFGRQFPMGLIVQE